MLQSIRPLVRENLAVGQYSGKGDAGQPGSKLGYLDDPSLQNKDSCTETFAAAVLHVHNPRWDGVPFVLKAGKALSDKKCEVRIHAVPNPNPDPDPSPNPRRHQDDRRALWLRRHARLDRHEPETRPRGAPHPRARRPRRHRAAPRQPAPPLRARPRGARGRGAVQPASRLSPLDLVLISLISP